MNSALAVRALGDAPWCCPLRASTGLKAASPAARCPLLFLCTCLPPILTLGEAVPSGEGPSCDECEFGVFLHGLSSLSPESPEGLHCHTSQGPALEEWAGAVCSPAPPWSAVQKGPNAGVSLSSHPSCPGSAGCALLLTLDLRTGLPLPPAHSGPSSTWPVPLSRDGNQGTHCSADPASWPPLPGL